MLTTDGNTMRNTAPCPGVRQGANGASVRLYYAPCYRETQPRARPCRALVTGPRRLPPVKAVEDVRQISFRVCPRPCLPRSTPHSVTFLRAPSA